MEAKIVFVDVSDLRLMDFLNKLASRYDLDPETNEDYRRFLEQERQMTRK